MSFQKKTFFPKTKIRVIGVGGAGCNAIDRMSRCKVQGVDLIAVNCDLQDLRKIKADLKVKIGQKLTMGLGAGMKPEIGKRAAQESRADLKKVLEGSDVVFITAGLGGGTGTFASGVVADIAKSLGALTIGVVTMPFSFEGFVRARIARQGLRDIKARVDTLLVIPNDRILSNIDKDTTFSSAFWSCDEILRQAVQGISDLILLPGVINIDFSDIKSIMKNSGPALFGIGVGRGEKRIEMAVNSALNSPFLDYSSIRGAKGILFNIFGQEKLSLEEVKDIASMITKDADARAKIIFGAVQDDNLPEDELKIILIATGLEKARL